MLKSYSLSSFVKDPDRYCTQSIIVKISFNFFFFFFSKYRMAWSIEDCFAKSQHQFIEAHLSIISSRNISIELIFLQTKLMRYIFDFTELYNHHE